MEFWRYVQFGRYFADMLICEPYDTYCATHGWADYQNSHLGSVFLLAMSMFWKLRHSNVEYSAVSFHKHGRNHTQHMYQGIIKTYTATPCYSACAEYVSEVTSPTQGTLSRLYIMYWTSGELIASTVRCCEDPICIYSQCTLVSSRFHNGIQHTTFALVLLERTKDSSFCCVGNV